jgi:hypothetical protein
MNTIYNIYESYYNSILSTTTSKLKNVGSVVDELSSTYKERFIKIVSTSAGFKDSQETLFRELLDKAIDSNGGPYIRCYIPKELTNLLIVKSNKNLTNDDFKGFPTNKSEYEFRTSIYFTHFVAVEPRLSTMNDFYKLPENKIITDYVYDVLRIGKTIIIRKDEVIYIWIDGVYRIVATFQRGPSKDVRNLYL